MTVSDGPFCPTKDYRTTAVHFLGASPPSLHPSLPLHSTTAVGDLGDLLVILPIQYTGVYRDTRRVYYYTGILGYNTIQGY